MKSNLGHVEIHRAKGKKSKEFFAREIKLKRVIGSPGETYKRRGGIVTNLIAKMKLYGGTKVLVKDCTGNHEIYWLYVNGKKDYVQRKLSGSQITY